jgi:hypothetical protein
MLLLLLLLLLLLFIRNIMVYVYVLLLFVYFVASVMDLISKNTFLVLSVFTNKEDSLIDDIYC